jgi:peptide/nickel transport system ATP-binding protein
MPSTDETVLVVRDLRVETAAGVDIVADISFAVAAGEILGVVGESGCGKTTTGLALLGHTREGTRFAGGSIVLADGRDVLRMGPRALRTTRGASISYVPQDPTTALSPRQRIGRQLSETLQTHGYGKTETQQRVAELMERVQLPTAGDFLRRYPFELSGGQQQRVAIAIALACKPRVVVLDEPTTGLDVTTQSHILELVRELSRDSQAGFVYVTHDLAVVDELADRVMVMYAGRIVESGERERVFYEPAHPYTSLLLSSVPRLSVRSRLVGVAGTAPPPGTRPHGCFFEPRCPLAIDRCRTTYPEQSSLGLDHTVSCWRPAELLATETAPVSTVAPAAFDKDALLAVEDLIASYGRGSRAQTVLHGVSLSIAAGECVALVGQSGSGKTTLGRCIAGLHRLDSGAINLNGVALATAAPQRSRDQRRAIQIVFQNPDRSLNPSQTIETILSRPLHLFEDGDRSWRENRIAELLERVRLPISFRHRYPRELSGGEKQRVAIARALAARPTLLISDEITSALDVSIQAAIVRLLEDLRDDGLAMLFITHNLALVNSVADRVMVLEQGVIREEGLTEAVVGAPSHPYTRELIAAAPDLGVRGPTSDVSAPRQ